MDVFGRTMPRAPQLQKMLIESSRSTGIANKMVFSDLRSMGYHLHTPITPTLLRGEALFSPKQWPSESRSVV
jgi:hypothetical protein